MIKLEKRWHYISQPYAWQVVVNEKDILVGQPHYGAQGHAIKIDPEHKERIQRRFEVGEEPGLSIVMAKQQASHDDERYEYEPCWTF